MAVPRTIRGKKLKIRDWKRGDGKEGEERERK